mgnify:CR=1 FL=1
MTICQLYYSLQIIDNTSLTDTRQNLFAIYKHMRYTIGKIIKQTL